MFNNWSELYEQCMVCKKCSLSASRKNVVFGDGNIHSDVIFVGEGPGADEDIQGLPFVGRSGQLLTKALTAVGLNRQEVYIANIVKCRPPSNRVPSDAESNTCIDYLRNQVALIKPKVIVCLGATAAKHIIKPTDTISKIRGTWIERKSYLIMPTFHPAALLRDSSKKALFWEDLKKIKAQL